MHICVELHNVDFTKLVLAKNADYDAALLTQRNGAGLNPAQALTNELERAHSGLNPDKKVRMLNLLN